jgi:1-aminocyclopropane-1-carboxylate deaminase/D-cysteine desulfhydrase-like pyridoxal-dependent ACC family enzyme
VQSNHARITAQSARRLGFDVILVLNGDKPEKPSANFLINSKLGIDIHYVSSREERSTKMAELAGKLESQGEKVYEIPLGASDEIGSLGFVHAFEELCAQEKKQGFEFDYLLHSSSSGGTQAGLEIGKRLFERKRLKIIGISSDNSTEEIRSAVMDAAGPILSRLEMDLVLDPEEISVDTNYIGPGYAIPSELSLEADFLFSKWEGLLLDPTYTAKAAAALIDYSRKGIFRKTDRVLFWHTGGLLNLFQ